MSAAFEEMLAFVLAQLSAPVEQETAQEGSVLITSGDPREVIVRLDRSQVTVAEYAVSWGEADKPVVDPIPIGTVSWSVLSTEAADRVVRALIAAARGSRLSKYAACRVCEQSTPPEFMDSDDVCQRCADQELDVVH